MAGPTTGQDRTEPKNLEDYKELGKMILVIGVARRCATISAVVHLFYLESRNDVFDGVNKNKEEEGELFTHAAKQEGFIRNEVQCLIQLVRHYGKERKEGFVCGSYVI